MRAACAILALLVACASPDTVTTGLGQHFDYGGDGGFAEDYTGQTVYVEATWHIRPREMVVDYSPASRLFLTELERAHPAPADKPSEVNVHLPEAPEPKKSELEGLADLGKDGEGNWTPWGAAVVIGALLLYREIRRPKPKPATP